MSQCHTIIIEIAKISPVCAGIWNRQNRADFALPPKLSYLINSCQIKFVDHLFKQNLFCYVFHCCLLKTRGWAERSCGIRAKQLLPATKQQNRLSTIPHKQGYSRILISMIIFNFQIGEELFTQLTSTFFLQRSNAPSSEDQTNSTIIIWRIILTSLLFK